MRLMDLTPEGRRRLDEALLCKPMEQQLAEWGTSPDDQAAMEAFTAGGGEG